MTTLTLTLDDTLAQALDRLITPGASREDAVVIALQEYLYRRERARRREFAPRDAAILEAHEEAERLRAEALLAAGPSMIAALAKALGLPG